MAPLVPLTPDRQRWTGVDGAACNALRTLCCSKGTTGDMGDNPFIPEVSPRKPGGTVGGQRGTNTRTSSGPWQFVPLFQTPGDNLGDAGTSMDIACPTCPPRPLIVAWVASAARDSRFIRQPPTACPPRRKRVLARFPAVGASALPCRRCPAQASRARAETVLQTWNRIRHRLPA
jgi:hypothetical protein